LAQRLQSDPESLDIEHLTEDQERYIEMVRLLWRKLSKLTSQPPFFFFLPLQNLDFGIFDPESDVSDCSDSDDSDSERNLIKDDLLPKKPEDPTKLLPSIFVLDSNESEPT
jgi:hypothetical protein